MEGSSWEQFDRSLCSFIKDRPLSYSVSILYKRTAWNPPRSNHPQPLLSSLTMKRNNTAQEVSSTREPAFQASSGSPCLLFPFLYTPRDSGGRCPARRCEGASIAIWQPTGARPAWSRRARGRQLMFRKDPSSWAIDSPCCLRTLASVPDLWHPGLEGRED